MVFDQIFLLALESLIPQALCCLKQPHLVEHKVIQPSGPLGQQPGDGLGNGVTSYRMAKHPAVVLVQRCDVEPHCARLALIGGNIPAMQQAQHATFFDAAICARVVLDELDNGCSYQFAGSRTTRVSKAAGLTAVIMQHQGCVDTSVGAYSMRLGGVKDTCCREGALKPEGLHSRS